MYFGGHNPPHFHIVHPEGEALISIENLSVLAGSAPAKALTAALEWAGANREHLQAKWRELQV